MNRVNVLLATALDKTLDYLAPEMLPRGTLVEAPLAGRKVAGVVLGAGSEVFNEARLKSVLQVASTSPLAEHYLKFIDWVAEYTLAPRGAVLALSSPGMAFTPPRKPYVPPEYR
ncbi:MAG: hypothetical protein LW853_07105, partial [Rickettsiales bacterium]|nr:hypothetical protein [Rickettsiales bacterium]